MAQMRQQTQMVLEFRGQLQPTSTTRAKGTAYLVHTKEPPEAQLDLENDQKGLNIREDAHPFPARAHGHPGGATQGLLAEAFFA